MFGSKNSVLCATSSFSKMGATSELTFEERLLEWEASNVMKFHDRIDGACGPVLLFYVPYGTYPNAKDREIHAFSARVMQGGKLVAEATCLAKKEQESLLSDATQGYISRRDMDTLSTLPRVPDISAMNRVFADFLIWTWLQTHAAFSDQLSEQDVRLDSQEMINKGIIQIVRSGMFEHLEKTFFFRAYPEDSGAEIFQEPFGLNNMQNPMVFHMLSSLFVGMGYSTTLVGDIAVGERFGLPKEWSCCPLADVTLLSTLYWAAKNNDPRLDAFKL